MTHTIVAFGAPGSLQDVIQASANAVGATVQFATDMAELNVAHMQKKPDAFLLRLDSPDIDEITVALHTHPKLEGVPLIALLPKLTHQAALRAISLGADDFIAFSDISAILARKLQAALTQPIEPPKPKQCRVLLADPSPLHCRVLSRLLVQAGFDVHVVTSLTDVQKELEEPKGYGLLILDLGLEGFDPRAFLTQLREKHGEASPPAIAMTHSAVSLEKSQVAAQAGFRHIHDKRRAPDELIFLSHEASVTDHARLRASPRMLCALLVGFRRPGERWEYGLSHNISLAGLFVRTIAPPDVGTELELEFTPPGTTEAISPRAKVMWRKDFSAREVRASPTGMGLKLIEPEEHVQRAMAFAVAQLASMGRSGT